MVSPLFIAPRTIVLSISIALMVSQLRAKEPDLAIGLVGHWPLNADARDISEHGLHAKSNGVEWRPAQPGEPSGSGHFDGRSASIDVTVHPSWNPGRGDFTFACWFNTEDTTDDNLGDIVSQYNATRRRGFHLGIKTNTGVTFNQANSRQLQFGIDNDRDPEWRDCGKPGKNSLLAFALATHHGRLFAGTCEPGLGDSGHVYQYSHGQSWIDCGSPAPCNAITAIASYQGNLYVGTGKYRVAGSSLAESENPHLGGRIFRYEGGTEWTDCGQLPGVEAVSGMVVYRGQLYAGSLYKPAGFFRYEGDCKWSAIPIPDGKRVEALTVYNGHLYASSYDAGNVYRYDGETWSDLGALGNPTENTQTYSFATYQGRLYAGTWRSGRVYRLEDGNRWADTGRLGEELEVMGMLVHNGRLVAGTLPLAEIHQFTGDQGWKRLKQLDLTPDVKYRRAWAMTEYQGQLYCSTLPSGRIHACDMGRLVTWDREFPTGWHHVTAMKSGGKLLLFVDGELKVSSASFNREDFDLSSTLPLKIGCGPNDFFHGRLRNVRIYNRALTLDEISSLATKN